MSYIANADWSQCTECGRCLMECPLLAMEKDDAVSAIRKLIRGEPAPEVFAKCTFCFNCNRYCPVEGLRPHELILQRALEHRGKVPGVLKYLCNGRGARNMFSDLYENLQPDEKAILEKWSHPPQSRDILWIGCIGKLSCRDLDNSTVLAPLEKFGPPDLCCGELPYRLGSWELYDQTISRTLAALEDLDIDRMVCYCGSCYNYFANILPRVYGRTLPFEVVSMYEWLWDRYENNEITVKKPRNFKAAIHESCYVSELGEQFAETLKKLYPAVGVETVELAHHGEANLSCGAVSVVRSLNLWSSIFKEQRRKYREVAEAGAAEMALNCPGCYVTLSFTSRLFGKKLRYMPDELLAAFGDEITVPLGKRVPAIAATVTRNFPRVVFG
ncbi:MAG: (Fe-S)-binding protein [Desulfosudaceae bacterium]